MAFEGDDRTRFIVEARLLSVGELHPRAGEKNAKKRCSLRREERVGRRSLGAGRGVKEGGAVGVILQRNINNKSFRSLSRGVALNCKRTIVKGGGQKGRGGGGGSGGTA